MSYIYTFVINYSQLFEKKYSRNNNYLKQEKFNENMHTCFYWLSCNIGIQTIWKSRLQVISTKMYHFCQWANLGLGELQCLNYLFLAQLFGGKFKMGQKPFASVEGENNTGQKISQYTVCNSKWIYIVTVISNYKMKQQKIISYLTWFLEDCFSFSANFFVSSASYFS